ncbi:hypothetical protein FSP39_020162 [Pinctada imbricata]|uniref:G-protein coupled receptors family 1 profile domain-containing protein n=1 Tax=Pinctada imbricata TaxID=66713 RepID=A0AA88XQE4_PINIB|nr:hypothetical protein FSP39_020162 [Pinctada imbricata]
MALDNSSLGYTEDPLNTTASLLTTERRNVVFGDMFLVAACLGGFGNGFVLFVYFKSSQLTDITMKLIMNLALTDLITAISLGMTFLAVRSSLIVVSYLNCLIFMIVPNYMFFVSQSVLVINTLDRYIAICHYAKYAEMMTRKALNIMLAVAWIYPIFLLSIPFFGFNYWEEVHACLWRNLLHEWVYITLSSVIITLMSISAFFYVLIMKKAWEFYRRFLPTHTKGTEEEMERIRAKKRAINKGKAMGVITLFFTICWLPSHILQFNFGVNHQGNDTLIGITLFMGTLNCIVNPFVYAWQKKDFRTEAKKIVRCRRPKQRGPKDPTMKKEHAIQSEKTEKLTSKGSKEQIQV